MKLAATLFLIFMTWPSVVLSQSQNADQIDWDLNFRPRFESVDQDGISNTSNAFTMRTLAAFELRPSAPWKARVEVIDVTPLNDDFNDTRNGNVTYPIVADPRNTDINELHLAYSGFFSIRAGRQAVRLNRTRFIGAQEFRQTMQVFDGAVIDLPVPTATRHGDLSLYAAYFDRRSTVRALSVDDDVGMVRSDWTWSTGNSLLLSVLWHDKQAQPAAAGTSYRIENIRWDGIHDTALGAWMNHIVEYAKQRPYANSEATRNTDYARAGAGLVWPRAFARIDYEVLGSRDGNYAFQTPLANNHAYLGWSDLFVVTPRQGVQDWWITFGGNVHTIGWVVEHHQLRSDFDNIDFGYETDVGATWTLRKGLIGRLQFARYRNGSDPLNTRPDTEKVWLTMVWVVR